MCRYFGVASTQVVNKKSNLHSAVFTQKRAVSNLDPDLILQRNDAVIYFTHTPTRTRTHRQRAFSCTAQRNKKCLKTTNMHIANGGLITISFQRTEKYNCQSV